MFIRSFIHSLSHTQNIGILQYTDSIELFADPLIEGLSNEDQALFNQYQRLSERICPICRGGDYLLEGHSLHCSGECHEVIETNKPYYQDPTSQRVWCEYCYKKIPNKFEVDGVPIFKYKLEKKMNTHKKKEEWITCSRCKQAYHQMCGLYNAKLKEQLVYTVYICPYCILNMNDASLKHISISTPTVEGI